MDSPKYILTESDMAREEAILVALGNAYQNGQMQYLHFSPAYDVTVARIAAISFALAAISPAPGVEAAE